MPTTQSTYRLLNEGETILETDDIYALDSWRPVGVTLIAIPVQKGLAPIRRLIPPATKPAPEKSDEDLAWEAHCKSERPDLVNVEDREQKRTFITGYKAGKGEK